MTQHAVGAQRATIVIGLVSILFIVFIVVFENIMTEQQPLSQYKD